MANIFCGFFALVLCARDTDYHMLYQAGLAIFFGWVFDTLDGRVARITRTQSSLGIELDSLSDAITFGAAPALLAYKWGLGYFGKMGIFIAFTYIAAAIMRLARFNVLALHSSSTHSQSTAPGAMRKQGTKEAEEEEHVSSKSTSLLAPDGYFIGLPTPAAAGVIVTLVWFQYWVSKEQLILRHSAVALIVFGLSYLMVSKIRFRTFKGLRPTKKTLSITFIILVSSFIISKRFQFAHVFLFLVVAYLVFGLAEELVRAGARLRSGKGDEIELDEDPEHDREVLEDLGVS